MYKRQIPCIEFSPAARWLRLLQSPYHLQLQWLKADSVARLQAILRHHEFSGNQFEALTTLRLRVLRLERTQRLSNKVLRLVLTRLRRTQHQSSKVLRLVHTRLRCIRRQPTRHRRIRRRLSLHQVLEVPVLVRIFSCRNNGTKPQHFERSHDSLWLLFFVDDHHPAFHSELFGSEVSPSTESPDNLYGGELPAHLLN